LQLLQLLNVGLGELLDASCGELRHTGGRGGGVGGGVAGGGRGGGARVAHLVEQGLVVGGCRAQVS
jgi:hypothetical protein